MDLRARRSTAASCSSTGMAVLLYKVTLSEFGLLPPRTEGRRYCSLAVPPGRKPRSGVTEAMGAAIALG